MQRNAIAELMHAFEGCSHTTSEGVEFWLARDIQGLLGYTKWDNFLEVLMKAQQSCKTNKVLISDHFADVGKMVALGSGAERKIDDMMLTRYACYLVAQNGNPRKSQIAFAQSYFATQTRKLEIIQENVALYERLMARKKLTETEKELSQVIFEQTGSDKNFALIRSKGDAALFAHTTQEMKEKRGLSLQKPLADFLPTILLKAKDFAAEITIFNAKKHSLSSEGDISSEHITNNSTIRQTLLERGIVPEDILPSEDIKKVERRLQSDAKKLVQKHKKT